MTLPWPAPLVLDRAALDRAITLPAVVEAVHDAYAVLARGESAQPLPMGFDLPGGEVHIKAAQLTPARPVVVKVASGFPGNSAHDRPTGDGALIVLDPTTGAVSAVLLDGGHLTDVRTAAATTVAARALSGGQVRRRLGLLGTGVQADLTLRTLAAVGLLPGEVALWGRTAAAAEQLVSRHESLTDRMYAVGSPREAVIGADLVITTTPSRSAVVEGDWLADDAVVIAIGADSVGKRECDAQVLERAGRIVVDSRAQSTSVGELQHADVDALGGQVVELPQLLAAGTAPAHGIQLCDLTGLGAADAAVAELALRAVAGEIPRRGD